MHSKSCFTNRISGRQLIGILGAALVQRDEGFTLVNIHHRVIYRFDIVSLVSEEGTLFDVLAATAVESKPIKFASTMPCS